MTPAADDDLRELTRFSAEIAADPLAVQAAGGNISVKSGAVMWIKASGTWLADAEHRQIMVPVAFQDTREAVLSKPATVAGTAAAKTAGADTSRFVVRGLHDSDLRPSVETAMHAVLPQKFVAHVHCVDTLAWAVQADPAPHLARLLTGLDWCFIPYVKPGLALARRVADRCSPSANVIVLGNHGLVVAAETSGDLKNLLAEARTRLRRPPAESLREADGGERTGLESALAETPFRPARPKLVHSLAFDHHTRKVTAVGTLFPDQAVFLGPALQTTAAGPSATQVLRRLADNEASAMAVIVKDLGVGIRKGALHGTDEVALCLAHLAARLRPGEPINYLAPADVAELLDWEAEKYRQAMNADRTGLAASATAGGTG